MRAGSAVARYSFSLAAPFPGPAAVARHDHRLPAAAALVAPLGDARRLAGPAAQIVELGAAYPAPANHFDTGDLRTVQREDPLDALAVADLTHGEG